MVKGLWSTPLEKYKDAPLTSPLCPSDISAWGKGNGKTKVWGAEGRWGGEQLRGQGSLVLSATQPFHTAAPFGSSPPNFLVMSGWAKNWRPRRHGEWFLNQTISSPFYSDNLSASGMGTSTFCFTSKWNWDGRLQDKDGDQAGFTPEERGILPGALQCELGLFVAKTLLKTEHLQVCSQRRRSSLSKGAAEKIWRWVHLITQLFLYSLVHKYFFTDLFLQRLKIFTGNSYLVYLYLWEFGGPTLKMLSSKIWVSCSI